MTRQTPADRAAMLPANGESRSGSWGKGHHVPPADFKGPRAKTTPSGFKQGEGLFCRVKLIKNSLEN